MNDFSIFKSLFRKLFSVAFLFLVEQTFAQPYADIATFGYQTFSGDHVDSVQGKNKTDDYVLNLFYPKVFKNGTTLLFRVNTETMVSNFSSDTLPAYSNRVSALSLPVGVKFVSGNKKWETILLGIPKIASDFKDGISSEDWQYGGVFLEQFVKSDHFKIKAGLYYNREAFGDFYVPLVGIDWKINNRIYLYGILPTNYRVEFNVLKDRLYMGLNLKSLTRSFRLSDANNADYVRYNEIQTKLFVDWFVVPKVIVFAEAGYSLGKNPLQYIHNTDEMTAVSPVYTPMKPYPIISVGLAYRIRLDLEPKAATNE